jgi:hypothetical protein
MERAASWPPAAQEELVQIGLEIEAEHKTGTYHATVDEIKAIDEALGQMERGEVISAEEAEVVIENYRRA